MFLHGQERLKTECGDGSKRPCRVSASSSSAESGNSQTNCRLHSLTTACRVKFGTTGFQKIIICPLHVVAHVKYCKSVLHVGLRNVAETRFGKGLKY